MRTRKFFLIISIFSLAVLANAVLYALLSVFTDEGNYIWSKTIDNESRRQINIACYNIFLIRFYVWFCTLNIFIAGFFLWFSKKSWGVFLFVLSISFAVGCHYIFQDLLAKNFYTIFLHQKVSPDYQDEPILSAGYAIGPYLQPHIKQKDFKKRIPVISGTGRIGYTPAIPDLAYVLNDTTEAKNIRGEVYVSLKRLGTLEAKQELERFSEKLIMKNDTAMYQYIVDFENGDMF